MSVLKNYNHASIAGAMSDAVAVNDIPVDFKSTLPPRKRAKTKEEKEQRRIERILRNRRAAHQSREKKRLHLQHLERKATLLEEILASPHVAKLVKSDKSLSGIYDEYQILAASQREDEPVAGHESPDSAVLNSQRTPESLLLSASSSKLTPCSNSAVSSPLHIEDKDGQIEESQPAQFLLEPVPENLSAGEVSFDSLLMNNVENPQTPILETLDSAAANTTTCTATNWNMLLTDNHDELIAYSRDEEEFPVLDVTDNSWGLDPLRNPAVIKLLI
ncbi:LAFA_0A01112g1_1 [Lachancea sp. 'fantastica']|nr:LAFA_0A01112g1_1 [Lachancea sp. 'fantastica']